jgi:curved DNA-binding protein CbpA
VTSPVDDLYALLELQPTATTGEIRAAFRRLAQVHHPDRPTGAASRMAAINRAYAILGNPERRRRYDLARRPGVGMSPAPAEPRPVEAPPWLLDLEHGRDLDDWRQMYAEEHHLWAQLLASQPANHPNRPSVLAALRRARRDQVQLENALRARQSRGPLTEAEFEREHVQATQAQAAAARAGCLMLPALLLRH